MGDADNSAKESPIAKVSRRAKEDQEALAFLLDQQSRQKDRVLALKTKMGTTIAYVSAVTLKWVVANVHYARQLPRLQEYIDPETGNPIVNDITESQLLQRAPDWRRFIPMVAYLARHKHHKFPPILVVAYQDWVHNDKADEWTKDGHAKKNSIDEQMLDAEGIYFDLNTDENTTFYALDGQHRLMALQGLQELVNSPNGKIQDRGADGNPAGTYADLRTDWSPAKRASGNQQFLIAEKIGIEIIPAVLKGETTTEALQRLRSTFVHVNQNAKRLTTGELILLDEDDGFRIVARRVAVTQQMLRVRGRVAIKMGQLPDNSHYYTTLETIATIAKNYLGQLDDYSGWKNKHKGMAMRPVDKELESATQKLCTYFGTLSRLPSHHAILQGASGEEIAQWRDLTGKDNMLFRPHAQIALADAIGTLEAADNEKRRTIDQVVTILAKQENLGQLKLHAPTAPWFGVLTEPLDGRMRRHKSNIELCTLLLVHLLGGGTPDENARKELQSAFAKARVVTPAGETEKAKNLEDNTVELNRVDLPAPWD